MIANNLWILAAALVIDAVVGDPPALWRRWPHPVVWMGRAVEALDRRLNDASAGAAARRQRGGIAIALLVAGAVVVGWLVSAALARLPYGGVAMAVIASVFLAGRSLHDHVRRVARAFDRGLDEARREVAAIVGRDPQTLDEAGVCRAAIESAAENASDGLVAPAFWFAILGLPGLLAYKVVNTADSMIGHRTDRYLDFGRATARLDDLVNLIPSRLTAALIALAAPVVGGSTGAAWAVVRTDARLHASPNAGWPEAAMAGGLKVALAGPRVYDGRRVDDPYVNAAGRAATPADIGRALTVLIAAGALLAVLVVALALVLSA